MPELGVDVAQAILAAVAPIELEARHTRREVKFVMGDEALGRLDLPVAQCRGHRAARRVHEGAGLEQPQRVPGDLGFRDLAVQLRIEAPADIRLLREGVNKPEPGVVPGPVVFGTGISQPDNEAQASHR